MTPVDAIAMLDRQLAANGQDVVLRRGSSTVTLRAAVRGYQPGELVSGIEQGDIKVVLSPTGLVAPWLDDPPDRGDVIEIVGREHRVEAAPPVMMGNVAVRFDVQVRG